MTIPYWWWLIAAVLAIAEMLTGTFYLLIIAAGCAVAGIAAFAGYGMATQLVTAAAVMIAGFLLLKKSGLGRTKMLSPDRDPDVLLDVGGSISVPSWDSDRETRVRYRGAMWAVKLSDDVIGAGQPGNFRIDQIQGSTLIVLPAE